MPRDLHALPRLSDRWSHLYLEHGRLQKQKEGLGFVDPKGGITAVPLDQFAIVLLGPGTTLTHAAARMLADNNTLVCWSGEQGVRLYAYGTGGRDADNGNGRVVPTRVGVNQLKPNFGDPNHGRPHARGGEPPEHCPVRKRG